jgi:putative addiction module antidote
MLKQRVRRVGNSLVVTLPAEELERLGIAEGDLIAFDPRKVETIERFVMPPEIQEAVASFWDRPDFQEGLDYLKDR